jgi:hypothetical protein
MLISELNSDGSILEALRTPARNIPTLMPLQNSWGKGGPPEVAERVFECATQAQSHDAPQGCDGRALNLSHFHW